MEIDNLLKVKGKNINVKWVRPVKMKKSSPHQFLKETTGKFAAGINYDNTKDVEALRELGALPEENQGLPWGRWIEFPYLIEHKGEIYVRLYPPSENRGMVGSDKEKKSTAKVRYLTMDGQEVQPDIVKQYALAEEFYQKKPKTYVDPTTGETKELKDALCFTVTAKHFVEFKGE